MLNGVVSSSYACGVELMDAILHDPDPAVWSPGRMASSPLKTMSDGERRPKRMGFGAGDKPINVFFGALNIAGPKEH